MDFNGINIVADIETLTVDKLPWIPDVVWASPPCTTYSIAAISHHRPTNEPKTEFAEKSDRLVINLLSLINEIKKLNPDVVWFIENPRGMLRKMPFMAGLPRETVWYCTYGDRRAKPTDIWSNHIYSVFCPDGWIKQPTCFNGNINCHHEPAPRGSATGTQGLSNNYERSKIPEKLCLEIIQSTIKDKKNAKHKKTIRPGNI